MAPTVAARSLASRILAEAGPTISPREAAVVLDVSPGTVYAAIARGDFLCRTLRLGRQIRIPTADLARALGIAP